MYTCVANYFLQHVKFGEIVKLTIRCFLTIRLFRAQVISNYFMILMNGLCLWSDLDQLLQDRLVLDYILIAFQDLRVENLAGTLCLWLSLTDSNHPLDGNGFITPPSLPYQMFVSLTGTCEMGSDPLCCKGFLPSSTRPQLQQISPTKNPPRTHFSQSHEWRPTKTLSSISCAQLTNGHITNWSTEWHDQVC